MPQTATLTPLTSLTTENHHIPPDPANPNLPNSSATTKPLLIYRGAFPYLPAEAEAAAETIEHHLTTTGVVSPQWRYTMYATSHFHSTTHEVLCVFSGRAKLLFGGEGNPGAVEVVVARGDVAVVPAGVAHRLVEDSSERLDGDGPGFQMVGAYPVGGGQWDMCYGREGEEERVKGIGRLEWFGRDPVYGEAGPVLEV